MIFYAVSTPCFLYLQPPLSHSDCYAFSFFRISFLGVPGYTFVFLVNMYHNDTPAYDHPLTSFVIAYTDTP